MEEKEIFKLLLVDDEETVIQTIIKKIDWKSLGFEVIGYASNGVKAIELVEETQPDVVLSDIKMPYMDGIEFAKHLKDKYPEIKILFFTGFDEFEYAREAVHLEVEEYILKPAGSAELTEVFGRVREKLLEEIRDKRNVEILEQYYTDSLPLLQANFFSALIEGKVKEEEIEKNLLDYRIEFSGPKYCSTIIHTSSSEIPAEMNYVLLTAAVNKMVQERLCESLQARSFVYQNNVVLIVEMSKEDDIARITDECDRFCRYVKRMAGAVITIGIGRIVDRILDLSVSYEEAKEAVSYRAIVGVEKAINITEIAPSKSSHVHVNYEQEMAYLFRIIRLNAVNEVKPAVEAYLEHISYEGKSIREHQIAIMELLSNIYSFVISNEIETQDILGDIDKTYVKVLGLEPVQLKNWMVNICTALCEEMASSRMSYSKSFVSGATDYVAAHFNEEDLSLDMISSELGISSAYFSTLFKKETGQSFVSYLTEYRMNKAAEMILHGDEKNYVIAAKVGYSDPNYFSYVFKRQFGVSPSKYGVEHA